MLRLISKTVIVTGGANGIGAEFVKSLHEEGATVAIADVDEKVGQSLEEKLGAQARFFATDVTSRESIKESFQNWCAGALTG